MVLHSLPAVVGGVWALGLVRVGGMCGVGRSGISYVFVDWPGWEEDDVAFMLVGGYRAIAPMGVNREIPGQAMVKLRAWLVLCGARAVLVGKSRGLPILPMLSRRLCLYKVQLYAAGNQLTVRSDGAPSG